MLVTYPPLVSNIKSGTYKDNRFRIHTFYLQYQHLQVYQSLHINRHFPTNEKASL